jgi:uncharacterized protein (TIGR03435 family)
MYLRTLSQRRNLAVLALKVAIDLFGSLGSIGFVWAQSATTSAFDVAAIKPSKSSDPVSILPFLSGRFSATNASVQDLLAAAYSPGVVGLPQYEILGGPDWTRSQRYDIEAKVDAEEQHTTFDQFQARLRALLADRFKVVVHQETRERQILALVIAKSGSKLLESTSNSCVVPDISVPPPTPGQGTRPACGTLYARRDGRMQGAGVEVGKIAQVLSGILNTPVTNSTGLNGRYDVQLEWTPDEDLIPNNGPVPQPPPEGVGPSLFTALQERLGLKLESKRSAVQVIVIDHVEEPTEN